jgi:uncharacterized membrane protein
VDPDALVQEYLGRLKVASGPLAVDRRTELIDEVREHIAAGLAEADRHDESTVRDILDRLGRPEDIIAAELDPDETARGLATQVAASPAAAGSSWGAVEVVALLLLSVGAVLLPFVGPLLGLGFVWLSNTWSQRQKVVASAIVLILLAVPVLGLFAAGASTGPQPG